MRNKRQTNHTAGKELLMGTTTKPAMLKSRLQKPYTGREGLHAVLNLMTDDFSYGRRFQTFLWGSPINIEARVDSAEALKIYVDECYGAPTANLQASGKTYTLIHNHGCLVDGKFGNSSFWSRTNHSILFTVQAFMLTEHNEEQVYIHCSLGVWDQKKPVALDRKSCSYDLFSFRWQLLEDPSQNLICDCCETACPHQLTPVRGDGEHSLFNVAIGPLTVRKRQSGWWEERCQSLKRFLLAGTSFVGSCLLGALFTGTLLVCALTLGTYCRRKKRTTMMPESPYPPAPVTRLDKESPVECSENYHALAE